LSAGRAPVQETGLQELIDAHRDRLHATDSHEEAVRQTELTFVIVPTPSDDRGGFSLQYAGEAFRQVGLAIKGKGGPHTVVCTSTVLPGATRYGLLPILERHAGRAAGSDLRVCYSPEFIALGSVIRDFLHPDFLLIGEFDRASGDHLEACYRDIIGPTPVRRMTLENAELAKLAVNAFVTTKITFANLLADLCARIPNGDVDVVADAIGLDTRIGRKYLSGGLGFGGPCFPRDNAALSFVASALGACPDLPIAVDRINRSSAERILDLLTPRLMRTSTVGVLGLAYKPLSQVIEESQAMIVVRALLDRGIQVVAYDPLAGRAADLELGGRARVVDSVRACVCDADVVLVATPDPEFQSLTADDFSNGSRVLVVDFWRILGDRLTNQPRIDYWPYGRGDHASGVSELVDLWSR
jgi:UDPglucose 6-dehydrogenase